MGRSISSCVNKDGTNVFGSVRLRRGEGTGTAVAGKSCVASNRVAAPGRSWEIEVMA